MLNSQNTTVSEYFPADYPIFHEDDWLRIILDSGEEYYQIENRQRIVQRYVTDTTNWLLAAGAQYPAGDISDWLEPMTGIKTLYVLAFGVHSDRNVQIKISMPGSGSPLFGTKGQGEGYITPSISPIDKPTITLHSINRTYVPSFTIINPSEYTLKTCVLGAKGFKYRIGDVLDPIYNDAGEMLNRPKHATTVNLRPLLE